jgi:hypothetical protein
MADVEVAGFTCPQCSKKVVVLAFNNRAVFMPKGVGIRCKCGYSRTITLEQVEGFEVWKAPETETLIQRTDEQYVLHPIWRSLLASPHPTTLVLSARASLSSGLLFLLLWAVRTLHHLHGHLK